VDQFPSRQNVYRKSAVLSFSGSSHVRTVLPSCIAVTLGEKLPRRAGDAISLTMSAVNGWELVESQPAAQFKKTSGTRITIWFFIGI
jgi:hypothetical protein